MNRTFELEEGKDSLHSIGGISLIGQALNYAQLDEVFVDCQKKGFRYQDQSILTSLIGILSQGREKYTDISQFRSDKHFMEALKLQNIPSEESLRQRLEMMPEEHLEKMRMANIQLLKNCELRSVHKGGMDFIPLDMDVTPFDNSGSAKEGVCYTYKGHDGYAPMMAYIGDQGYTLNQELRPGSQHAQKAMPEFLEQSFAMSKQLKLKHPLLLRLDSAHDAQENFSKIPDDSYFIIKRNLRQESKEQYLALARRIGRKAKSREGKNVYFTEIHHKNPGNHEGENAVPIACKVTERLQDHEGNELLIPELEVETYWTNLPLEAEDIIELYHEHGTSEQFHSEYKTDMNVERLPSGKFSANQLYLSCAMLAYNCLRLVGELLILCKNLAPVRIKSKRRRLRCVIRDLIFVACKRVKHAGKKTLKFGRHCPWFPALKFISQKLS